MEENKDIPGSAKTDNTTEAKRPLRAPRYSTRETQGGVTIEIDLPGVKRDEIEIDLEGRQLSVRTKSTPGELPSGFRAVSTEFESADFERSFTLAGDVDAGNVGATFKNGVLVLNLGAKRPEKRTIPVIEA